MRFVLVSIAALSAAIALGIGPAVAAPQTVTPKGVFLRYINAIGKARTPVVRIYPEVRAALSDIANQQPGVGQCSPGWEAIRTYQQRLATLSNTVERLRNRAISGSANKSYATGAMTRADAYASLIGYCASGEGTVGPTLGSAFAYANAGIKESNTQFSAWRQAVVLRAHRLHVALPRWVYKVGVA